MHRKSIAHERRDFKKTIKVSDCIRHHVTFRPVSPARRRVTQDKLTKQRKRVTKRQAASDTSGGRGRISMNAVKIRATKSAASIRWVLAGLVTAHLALSALLAQPAHAAWQSNCNTWGKIFFGKYYAHNSKWGNTNNGWGQGWQCVGRESTNTSNAWKADFDWWNNPNISDDEWHIKAFPSCVVGWQWGYANSDRGGLPVQLSANKNVTTSWNYSINASNWKGNAIYDLWLDWSQSPGGHPTDEIMIFLNYSSGAAPTGGYQGTAYLAGANWNVYKSNGSWQIISFVRQSQTNSVSNMNIRDFLNYASQTKNWISRSKYLISVQAGHEIWRGKGNTQTNSYSLFVS
jgi:hypothetical protein